MRVRLDVRLAAGEEAALLAWPWTGGEETRAALESGDSSLVTLELRVPRDSLIFSAEVFHPGSRELHFARYVLAPLVRAPLELSDILLTEVLPEADSTGAAPALAGLLVPADSLVGIRVEVTGAGAADPLQVELSFAPAESPSLLARAAGWAGRQLGLAGGTAPPRVRWQTTGAASRVLHVNLGTPRRAGQYFVQVSVAGPAGHATARRLVRAVSGS